MTDLTADEQFLLQKLHAQGAPALESQLKGIPATRRAEVLQALIGRGDLIEVLPPQGRTRKPRYRLTPRGRELAASLPPAAKARAARAPSPRRITAPSLVPRIEELRTQIAAHESRISRLEAMLAGPGGPPSPPSPAAEMDYQEFRSAAYEAFGRLDRTGQTLGVVPIPDLRRALGDRVTRRRFDEYLLQLHRERVISLLPHHDPASLPEDRRADALHHPTAGLLYFIRWVAP